MSTVLWCPDGQRINSANITQFMAHVQRQTGLTLAHYDALYQWSITDRAAFWQQLAAFFKVRFHHTPEQVLVADHLPGARWFPGATLNYAEHLLQCRDNKPALRFRSEHGAQAVITYSQLYQQVAAAQSGLITAGVVKGDRVAALMPNCPETVVMMLATTALGAIWSSCSPDFGEQGVVDRFGQIEPKVLLVADGYHYNGKIIDCRHKIVALQKHLPGLQTTVLVPFISQHSDTHPLHRTTLYGDFLNQQADTVYFQPLPFAHPLFILYSSGTTGRPKCIVHGHGGTLLQHLKELSLHTNVTADDTICYFTTCGWMMWNWLVSALALRATVLLYEGSPAYPRVEMLFDLAQAEQVTVLGTSPKYLTAVEKAGVKPAQTHDLTALHTLLTTGSPLLHSQFDYVYQAIKKDVCLASIAGGTDIISCFALGCPLLPVRRGELQCRGLGMDVRFVNSTGQAVIGEKGELTCHASFPAMPVGFWRDPDHQRYQQAYFHRFPSVWAHGDYGELTEQGGVIIYGRADAVLNPGGVRIGTAEIYRQIEKIDDVLDSVAIGQAWQGDTRIVLFVQLRPGKQLGAPLLDSIRTMIRTHTTPRHVPAKILQVADIPKTRSGKTVELAVSHVVHQRAVANTAALANPEALVYFQNRPELLT